jgi:hypothetical protein
MTSIALAITALTAALVPVAPANATYGPAVSVYATVITNDGGPAVELARLEGLMAFDDSNTKYWYSLSLCRRSGAYPMPTFVSVVNGSSRVASVYSGSTSAPGCTSVSLHSAEVFFGSTVSKVRFDLTAGWFSSVGGGSGSSYRTRTDYSFTYDNPFN